VLKSRAEVEAVVARYVDALREQGMEVDWVYLFGSYLRGTAHEYSDIDVVVVSPGFADKPLWERPMITGRAAYLTFKDTGESVQALAKTPEEVANRNPASFLDEILKDAEAIYEARRAGPEMDPPLGAGVDRTIIRERLKLSPAERLARITQDAQALQALRSARRSRKCDEADSDSRG
jgi:uncharacterized protein